MRVLPFHLSILSLASLLMACSSNGSGSGGKGASDASLDTSTPDGSGGVGEARGEPEGHGDASSSGEGGATGTAQTGGSSEVDAAAASGGAGGGAVVKPDGGLPGGCRSPTSYANLFVSVSGHSQAESDDKVSKAWSSLFDPKSAGTIYFDGPGADESYVEDIFNNDVRSEGMSYGMMIAVQLNHQPEFDRIWTWVRNHMANGTGEIRWSCKTSGAGCARNGAPDGEEYFATALIFASHRWGDGTGPAKIAYATEAKWVLDLIRTKYFDPQYHLVKFVSNSSNVDPSYVLPAFYKVWACFDRENADFWSEAVSAGREYMHKVVDSNGVCPYQASFTATNPQAANSDSLRCVVNLMMDWYLNGEDTWQKDTYATKFGAYSSARTSGGATVGCNATLGFALPASSGKSYVDKLWSIAVPSHVYWDGVLYMLGLLHVSGNFHIW